MKKTFFRQLFPVMILVSFIPLLVFAFFSLIITKDLAVKISRYELTETAKIVSVAVTNSMTSLSDTATVLGALAAGTELRLTVIDRGGKVLYDSHKDSSSLENHASREEVRDAFESGTGSSWRQSVSTGMETIYAAVRLDQSPVTGDTLILRAALPMPLVALEMRNMTVGISIVLAVILCLSVFISFLVANRLRRPVSSLERTAERWARGELDARSAISEPLEIARLSEIMNSLISELKFKIISAEKTSEEIRAVFDAMAEAVIVTDSSGNVVARNPKADLFFCASVPAPIKGAGSILIYTRNSEITALEAIARSGATGEAEITPYGKIIRHLNVIASPVSRSGGAVIVATDITRLLRLETVRKDFVANVSHELKTPIQSIRGFAETLASGALDDRESAGRFVSIIARQAERMDAIIGDLLTLARIERAEENDLIEAVEVSLQAVLDSVVEMASPASLEKNIRLVIEENENAVVRGSQGLLEQAVFNLVDNAVKFSPAGSEVFLSIKCSQDSAAISVRDCGPGIPSTDKERIFERFFRVDKSRSRDSGGTGLGLAIVKHIALVHKGSISVESEPGTGSVFTLEIPLAY